MKRANRDRRNQAGWGPRMALVVALLAAGLAGAHAVHAGGVQPMISTCGYPPAPPPSTACFTRWVCVDFGWEPSGFKAAGTSCDDYSACTYSDKCDGQGNCLGTSISCVSDTCTTRACNGTSSCSITAYAGTTTPCNDGKPCTTGDHCNGSGQCVAGATVARDSSCPTPTACGQVCDGVSPYCQPAE